MITLRKLKEKPILDVCCGSKMFWFNKQNPNVLFGDIRREKYTLCDGRKLNINPDIKLDFTDLPFKNETFRLIVFDPPHLKIAGKKSWMAKKYGVLGKNWKKEIKLGFSECFRVLGQGGVLIFKWNETQIKTSEILKLTAIPPLFGHISGKSSNTHWICFMKIKENKDDSN